MVFKDNLGNSLLDQFKKCHHPSLHLRRILPTGGRPAQTRSGWHTREIGIILDGNPFL